MFKGIEPCQGFKQPFEGQASFFQETHIRFAVQHQLFLEVKDHVLGTLLLMPRFQGLTGFGGHGFGHVVIEGWDEAHVCLVLGRLNI